MAKDNGGVIGVLNTPTTSLASGVWMLMSEYQARVSGTWPSPFNIGSSSARFNSGSSDYLNRTFGSPTNNKIFTFSFWIKRGDLAREQHLFNGAAASQFYINSEDKLYYYDQTAGGTYKTTQVFRDVSAWYHIVVAEDTTQATAGNRVKIYVNGTQVTAFDIQTNPTQNNSSAWNTNATAYYVGRYNPSPSGYYWNGYFSEVYFIDGQQLTPSSFGETDSTTGIWIPKAYTGTYGTNGFYLNFSNASSLGTDSSGNGNNFTVNNLTSVDQTKDHPTNNFATMNPLRQPTGNPATLTNGNLTVSTQSTGYYGGRSTISVSSGKWYFEAKLVSYSAQTGMIGIQNAESYTPEMFNSSSGAFAGYSSTGWSYSAYDGNIVNNNSGSSYGNTYASGDIISVALDLDNLKLYFAKNGTWQNSGVPTSGATGTGAVSITSALTYLFAVDDGGNTDSCVWDCNFGGAPYTVSGGYSDANGYGNFSYQPPSGYFALCTNNLASNG